MTPPPEKRHVWKNTIRWIVPAAIFLSLIWIASKHLRELDLTVWHKHPAFLTEALVWALLSSQVPFVAWAYQIRRALPGQTYPSLYRIYWLATASRYVPGGQILQYATLMHYSKGGDGLSRVSVAAMFCLLLCTIVSGTGLFLLNGHLVYGKWEPVWTWTGCFALAAGLAIGGSPKLFLAIRDRVVRLIKKVDRIPPPGHKSLLFGTASMAFAWLLMALSCVALCRALTGTSEPLSLGYVVAAITGSYLLGYVSFLTPGGVGIREGLLTFFLAKKIPVSAAVLLSLGSSLSMVACDFVFAAPFLIREFAVVSRRQKADEGVAEKLKSHG